MSDSETVLSIPIEAGEINAALDTLQSINDTLIEIKDNSLNLSNPLNKNLNNPIKNANKNLKQTNSQFSELIKKIKLTKIMGMGITAIAKGAGLMGLSAGAILFGALKNVDQNVKQEYSAKDLGLSVPEIKALEVSSEKITGDKNSYVNALNSIVKSLNDTSKAANLAELGLNQSILKTLSPEKALEEILNSVKNKPKDIRGQVYREAFQAITGGGLSYNVATKEGAGDLAKYFNEYLGKYSGVDFEGIQEASKSLIDFRAQLDLSTQKIGGNLARPLTDLIDKMTPALEKMTNSFAKFIDSISEEDIDKFINNAGKIFGFIAKAAGATFDITSGLFSDEKPDIVKVEEQQIEKTKKGETGAVIKEDLRQGAIQIGNLFSEEGRKENESLGLENFIISGIKAGQNADEIKSYGEKLTTSAVSLGYLSKETGDYTQKAIDLQGTKDRATVTREKIGSVIKNNAVSLFNKITGKKEETITDNSIKSSDTENNISNDKNISDLSNFIRNSNETNNIETNNQSDLINNNSSTKSTNNNTTNTKANSNTTTIHQININVRNQKEAIDTFNDLSKSINTQSETYYTGSRGR